MSKLQKILFAVLLLAIIVLIIIFWGTIFSGILVYMLIMALSGYVFNRFVNVDRKSEFAEDDNY